MSARKDLRYLGGLSIFIAAFYLVGRNMGTIGKGARLPYGQELSQQEVENIMEQAKEVLNGTREEWEEFVREMKRRGLRVVATKDRGIVIYDCEGNIISTEF